MARTERASKQVQAEQLRALSGTAGVTAAMVALGAVAIVAAFWSFVPETVLGAWLAGNVMWAVWVLGDREWRKRRTTAKLKVPLAQQILRALLLGLIWGGLPWIVLPAPSLPHLLLVGVALTAVMVGGAVRHAAAPAAAYTFIVALAVPAASAILMNLGMSAVPAVVALVGLAIVLGWHLRRFGRVQSAVYRAKADLADRNDTIGLLINDLHGRSGDWLWQTDAAGLVRDPSERFAKAAGLSVAKLAELPIHQLTTEDGNEIKSLMEKRATFRGIDICVRAQGRIRHWRISGRPAYDPDHAFLGYRGVCSDITDSVVTTERLSYLAHHDSLTGLWNRAQFLEAINEAIANVAGGSMSTLFLLDLDEFKGINDTLGHPIGDELLAAVAKRLDQRFGGSHIVARLGGDEFAILGHDALDAPRPAEMASHLIATFADPFALEGVTLTVRTSVGVAPINQSTAEGGAHDLLRSADVALYRAKAEGSGYKIFEPSMNRETVRHHALHQALALAVERREFRVEFQPIVDIKSPQIACLETLIRWAPRQFGEVSPAEFVPIAEEAGLMNSIGDWVMRRAMEEAATWPSDVKVAVNLSPVQIRDTGLVGRVKAALDETGLDPRRLELEITESMFLVANTETKTILWRLKRLGASIVMDDFGTGYSSLGYLRDFPFDKIKIDQSFVASISTDLASRAIVQAVVGLGETLKMKVVAEGIELPAQFEMVKSLGCNQFQGYAFSRPVPAFEVHSLLEAGRLRTIAAEAAAVGRSAEVITPNWSKITAA